ncbi:LuxR family transcriptional regulator [Rhodococcus fascians]|nr:LuxR family transcriptional regulator [Rhodococcus fascians]MBY3999460.1 LuxR family transcriptional regulator [Rhodococcus fascians]MBY4004993.1 LuxR family transcriptional regulator [Rhodococcus fascians]MBY4010134.1 LuxR family transcriptional regulator [Rhodococcus fascians]MBY4020200.1 LuxR family transcriptional regulator [Rhodococcus fascians]
MKSTRLEAVNRRRSLDAPPLTKWQYQLLFALLDECSSATNLKQLKSVLLNALDEFLQYPNTTFLVGQTYNDIFNDSEAVTRGRMTDVRDEYQARWRGQDIFRLPDPAHTLTVKSVLTHTQIGHVPPESRLYLSDYLYRHNLYSATAVHLHLANDNHALIGIFDSAEMEPDASDLYLLSLAARQLSVLARTLPSGEVLDDWSAVLTPRQRQVGDLVALGSTNGEIATKLGISIDAVKKHVSRIFERLAIRNRAEFVRLRSSFQHS